MKNNQPLADRSHSLYKRLDDYIRKYERTGVPVLSSFMAPGMVRLAGDYLSARVPYEIVPSYEESIYRCLAIGGYEGGIVTLTGTVIDNGRDISQRNIYGALMGLDIAADRLGDVWMEGNTVYITVVASLAPDILQNLVLPKPASLQLEVVERPLEPHYQYANKPASVSSMRLDGMVKAAAGVNREEAQKLVRSGDVKLNLEPADTITQLVEPGDIISIRGYGRYRIAKQVRTTRSGNMGILIQRFI